MITKLRLFLIGLLGAITLFGAMPALAADCCGSANSSTQSALQCGTNAASNGSCPSPGDSNTKFNNILSDVLNILTVLSGVMAVIMVVIAGFRFVTSGGNPDRVKSARSALMYAIIGIVVIALAQIIVQFVLNKTVNAPSASLGEPIALVSQNS